MEDRGDDPAELIRIYGNAITQAILERPDNMTVTIHMCRGNARSSWLAEGGYEPVAENMFAGVPVDGFLWSGIPVVRVVLNRCALRLVTK